MIFTLIMLTFPGIGLQIHNDKILFEGKEYEITHSECAVHSSSTGLMWVHRYETRDMSMKINRYDDYAVIIMYFYDSKGQVKELTFKDKYVPSPSLKGGVE